MTLAVEHGLAAAVVMKYLAYCCSSKRAKEHDGRRWFRVNLDHLAEQLPYLSRSCLADTLQRLSTGDQPPLQIHQENRRGYDRTNNYAFTDPQLMAQTRTQLRYFDPQEAGDYGLPAALILHNLRHWEGERKAEEVRWRTIQPGDLSKHLPLSSGQVRDALKRLVADGVLEPRLEPGCSSRKQYRLAAANNSPATPAQSTNAAGMTFPDEAVRNLDGSVTNLDMGLPNPDMDVTKPDGTVRNLDETLRNLDNDNSYQLSLAASLAASPQQPKNYPMRSAEPRAVGVSLTLSSGEAVNVSLNSQQVTEDGACRRDAPAPQQPASPECDQPSTTGQAVSPPPCRVPVEPVSPPPILVPSGWPAEFATLWQEVREEVVDKLGLEPSRTFDEQVCWRAIRPLLEQQSVEQLERWYQRASWQANYPEMIKLVEAFPLPSLPTLPMGWDDNFLRRVMVAYLTSCIYDRSDYWRATCQAVYRMKVDHLLPRLTILWKEREAANEQARIVQTEEKYRALQRQHRSKDADNEDDANRSAAEKVKILRNGIIARNRIGWLTNQTQHVTNLLRHTEGSFHLARKFFDLNPELTPGHLLKVMDAAAQHIAEHPLEDGEYDPHYNIRKGAHLTSLLKTLNTVLTSLEMANNFPAFNELPAEDAAKDAVDS